MRDYEELVRALREADSLSMCGECGYKGDKKGPLFAKAADAIEEAYHSINNGKTCRVYTESEKPDKELTAQLKKAEYKLTEKGE